MHAASRRAASAAPASACSRRHVGDFRRTVPKPSGEARRDPPPETRGGVRLDGRGGALGGAARLLVGRERRRAAGAAAESSAGRELAHALTSCASVAASSRVSTRRPSASVRLGCEEARRAESSCEKKRISSEDSRRRTSRARASASARARRSRCAAHSANSSSCAKILFRAAALASCASLAS